MLLLTLPKDKFRAFGEYADLISTVHLAGGHQAIKRVLKLAGENVLEVGSSVLRIAPVMENQRFGAGGELHLEGRSRMLVEDLASLGDFKVQDFFQIAGSKRGLRAGPGPNRLLTPEANYAVARSRPRDELSHPLVVPVVEDAEGGEVAPGDAPHEIGVGDRLVS